MSIQDIVFGIVVVIGVILIFFSGHNIYWGVFGEE